MKSYFLALFVLGTLVVPGSSSARAGVHSHRETRAVKFDQVYLGSVTRSDGVIYLYGDSGSGDVTYAEFVSAGHSYELVEIVNGKTDYTIVKGRFTFIDENSTSKVILLNNASFD